MAIPHVIASPEQRQDDYWGRRFGHLIVTGFDGWTKNGLRLYRVRCDCGTEKTVYKCALDREDTRSCGCLSRKATAARSTQNVEGVRFGRLVAVRPLRVTGRGWFWACRCDCGGTTEALLARLNNGTTRSCGCLPGDLTAARSTTHGASSGGGTHEYRCWEAMKERCLRADHEAYPRYGGAGVTVCPEWVGDFAEFLAHIGHAPSEAHTVERIDNRRGYEPGNVRWATRAEQNRNKGSNVVIVAGGRTMCRAEWDREFGLYAGRLEYLQRVGRLAEEFARRGLPIQWVGKRRDLLAS